MDTPAIQDETKPSARGWPGPSWTALLEQHEDKVFLVLTLVIGALAGLTVVAFIVLTERLGMRLYPATAAAWRRLLVPVAGSLAMGYLLYRYFPDARGSGVPQTKAALFAREGNISLGTVLGKFFCTSATLASGIPLGREGPSVQVGAGIASVLGRALRLRPEKVKALLPVGAAAAVAAAFNTPLAAVVFSLEEVMGDLNAPVLGSVVLASATSWAMLRLSLGNNPLFHVPQYELVHPLEFAVYAALGVAGGLLSATFTKLLRVAMLLPLVVALSYVFRANNIDKAGRRLPGFLVVFAGLVVLNSTGIIPTSILATIKSISRWCLVTAIAALGMKTSLKAMADVGGRAIALIVAETIFLAILVLAVVVWKV